MLPLALLWCYVLLGVFVAGIPVLSYVFWYLIRRGKL